ncbi:MAG: esterase/lipase family protein [Actinomycetota bacterium]|nr:alpha/beta fold hydrolase [Actinomycetota bacterium]
MTPRDRFDATTAASRSIGSAIGRAMRRPRTYAGFARELVVAGVNLALYPAGLLSEALKIEERVRFDDRFSRHEVLHYLDPEAATTPILLLHGAFHNRSAFLYMKSALHRHGFRHVETMNYNVIGHDIPELAQRLHDRLFEIMFLTGATKVHLVAHSLGGLVARYYIQELGGDEKVHTCVTLGTPHQGTYAAVVGRGRAARQVRPNSPLIKQLHEGTRASDVRYIAYYSNIDSVVIPASNAKIAEPLLRARNVLVKDVGHLGLLTSRVLIRSVAESLATLDVNPAEASDVPAAGSSGIARTASGE